MRPKTMKEPFIGQTEFRCECGDPLVKRVIPLEGDAVAFYCQCHRAYQWSHRGLYWRFISNCLPMAMPRR